MAVGDRIIFAVLGGFTRAREFQKTGEDPETKGALGTLTLYVDNEAAGSAEIKTQPGRFTLAGDGLAVGRGAGSAVSRDYGAGTVFPFRGGKIERVVVDVSGEEFVDHDEGVRRWLLRE